MNVTDLLFWPTSTVVPDFTTIMSEVPSTFSDISTFSDVTTTVFPDMTTILPEISTIIPDFTSTLMPEASTAAGDIRTWLTDLVMKRDAVQGGFLQAFVASLSVVIVSELGDKTFFIAAIMAMKHPRIVVFAGAISALVFMTILSAAFGWIATVIPRVYTHYISAALFAIFGLKMLRDGWKMNPNEGQEELEEVQSELKRREDADVQTRSRPSTAPASPTSVHSESPVPSRSPEVEAPGPPEEQPQAGPSTQPEPLRHEKEETLDMLEQGQAEIGRRRRNAIIKVLLQAASLTFLAEWGDRSQLATVVLATREDAVGVVVGGSLGHALCTGLAVIGGRMVAQKISVRTVTIIGGVVFLFFAVSALIMGPGD